MRRPVSFKKLPGALSLAILTGLVFVGQVLVGAAQGSFPGFLGVDRVQEAVAHLFGAMLVTDRVFTSQPLRLVTSIFVHFGVLHVGMNMLAFSHLSRVAEPAVGSARLVIAFVWSGIVGNVITIVSTTLAGGPMTLSAGASGAVFGIMGVILGFLLRRRNPLWKRFAMEAVFLSVMFGFVVNASGVGVLINNAAHVGGLLAGAVFGWAFGLPERRNPAREPAVRWIAGLSFALCVISLIAVHA